MEALQYLQMARKRIDDASTKPPHLRHYDTTVAVAFLISYLELKEQENDATQPNTQPNKLTT
jgi:hypothetical protein